MNNDKLYFKTNKNDDLIVEKKVKFFDNEKLIKETTFEKKGFHNNIISFCKGKKITHIQINGFKLSKKAILIKKKRTRDKIITGNLFEFSNVDLKFQKKC